MTLVLASLAVYKAMHLTLALLPREPMPWVKVVLGTILSFGAAFLAGVNDVVLSAFAIATIAGATHTVLRLLTYLGDMALRKAVK